MKTCIFILVLFSLLEVGCTVNQENPPEPIQFGDAVGNYFGEFRQCTISNTSAIDSICQPSVEDIFRVIILDKSHIRITSSNSLIQPLKIPFVGPVGSGNDKRLNFRLIVENIEYKIYILPSSGVLEYYSTSLTPQGKFSDNFVGVR